MNIDQSYTKIGIKFIFLLFYIRFSKELKFNIRITWSVIQEAKMLQQSCANSNVSMTNNKACQEQQQTSDHASQPSKTCGNMLVFILLGFYFMIFGIIQLVTNTYQSSAQFLLYCPGNTNICASASPQFLSFNSQDTVSIYLQGNIQSRHDIYTLYNSDPMLQSQLSVPYSSCGAFSTNQQILKSTSVAGTMLNPTDHAIPCGFFASKFPKGTLKIFQNSTGVPLTIKTDSLVLQTSAYINFQNVDLLKQWIDLTDSRFKSWMQESSSLILSRYWGYISQQISGNYEVSYQFDRIRAPGELFTIKLNNNKAIGGFNIPLCVVNFVYALVMFLASACTFFLNRYYKKIGGTEGIQTTVFTSNNKKDDQDSFEYSQIQNSIAKMSKQEDQSYFNFKNPFSDSQQQKVKRQIHVKVPKNTPKRHQVDCVKEEQQQKPSTNNRMIRTQNEKRHKKMSP